MTQQLFGATIVRSMAVFFLAASRRHKTLQPAEPASWTMLLKNTAVERGVVPKNCKITSDYIGLQSSKEKKTGLISINIIT